MDILEVLDQVRELLRQKGRVTYRILKRQFALDDEALEDLKDELIEAERVAADENGKVLVWTGDDAASSTSQPSTPFELHSPTPGRAHSRRARGHGIPWCGRR